VVFISISKISHALKLDARCFKPLTQLLFNTWHAQHGAMRWRDADRNRHQPDGCGLVGSAALGWQSRIKAAKLSALTQTVIAVVARAFQVRPRNSLSNSLTLAPQVRRTSAAPLLRWVDLIKATMWPCRIALARLR